MSHYFSSPSIEELRAAVRVTDESLEAGRAARTNAIRERGRPSSRPAATEAEEGGTGDLV